MAIDDLGLKFEIPNRITIRERYKVLPRLGLEGWGWGCGINWTSYGKIRFVGIVCLRVVIAPSDKGWIQRPEASKTRPSMTPLGLVQGFPN